MFFRKNKKIHLEMTNKNRTHHDGRCGKTRKITEGQVLR